MHAKKPFSFVLLALFFAIPLTACQAKEVQVTRVVSEKEIVVQTVIETAVEQETIVITATPAAEPGGERTLVICIGREPTTLYGFYPFRAIVQNEVLAAVYDGPYDTRSFGHQPVILEKIPSLADGDAVIDTVRVAAGDLVVNNDDLPVALEEGDVVRPAGCNNSNCAITFDGTPLEMEQMVVTFMLVEGITWSDSQALTARDSVFGFELYRDPDSPTMKYIPGRTASYEATDDYTTVWTGLPGFRDTEYMKFFFTPRPEHVWGDMTAVELLEAEESSRKPLGWGPYVIDEWITGDHITLHRNERYWRAKEGLPRFDKLIYRFTGGSPGAGLAALLSGECDILDRVHGLQDYELLLELQAKGQINASFVSGRMKEHASFGIRPAESYERVDFFGDVRTRRAIAHCMDRQAIVDTVLSGQSVVLDTFLPPEHPLHNPDVTRYAFDVAQGSALLEEVGWIDDDGDPTTPRVAQAVAGAPNGTPLEFSYWTTTNYERQQAAQVLRTSLAECGVMVNLEYWNPGQFFAEGPEAPLWGRRFDMAQFAWTGSLVCYNYTTLGIPGDPEALGESGLPLHPTGWSGNNITGFSNPEYDAACDAAIVAMPGTPEQKQHFMEAQRIYAEELPSVPLYSPVTVVVTRPDLTGFVQDPTDSLEFSNIEEYDIAD